MARFVFRRRPFFTLVLIAILAGPPAGFLMLLFRDAQAGAPLFPGLIFAAVVFGTIAIVACGLRAWTRPKQAPAIELRDEHALFPASAGSKRVKTIRYDEFLSVNVIGKGRWANLLIGTERRSFVYPVSRFELGAAAVGELCAELRRRIAALPDGISRLGEIKERESISANATKSTPSVSWAMLALVAAAYIWTSLNGALDDPFGLTAYGANVPVLVGDGEWYRLLAANFLHVNLIHAYLNALGILILGMLLERLIGSWRLLCIYLVSAAAGALASTWASVAVLSVGASTAVFGLLGALALVNWRFRTALPGGFRQPWRWWVVILGINVLLPVIVPIIDYWAHIGGFAAGAIAAALVCRDKQSLLTTRTTGAGLKAVTVGLSILYVFALTEAVIGSTEAGEADEARVARAFVAQRSARSAALNSVAWHYATKPGATRVELDLAEQAARNAVAKDADNDSYIDTLATVHYRRRDFDQAIATQRRAVALSERRVLVSQMGRFLDARMSSAGVTTVAGADAAALRVSVVRTSGAAAEPEAIQVDVSSRFENGLEIYALDRARTRLIGTLHIVMGPGVEPGSYRFVPERGLLRTEWPRSDEPIVAYADASGCDCDAGAIRGRYFFMDRQIAELP